MAALCMNYIYDIISLLASRLSIQPFATRHPWTALLFWGHSCRCQGHASIFQTAQKVHPQNLPDRCDSRLTENNGVTSQENIWGAVEQFVLASARTIFEGVLSSIFDNLGESFFNTDFFRWAAVPIAHRGSLAAWHQHSTGLAAMRAWREHEVLLRLFRARLPKARPNLRDCQMTGLAMYRQQPSQEYFWSMRPSYS